MTIRPPAAYTLLVAELIERREALGHTQRSFAPLIGMTQNNFGPYEAGRAVPLAPRLVEWADALDCDLVLVPREER